MSLVEASLSLRGDHFSPAAFEAATGLTLAGRPKNEPRHIRGYMGFKVRDHKPGNAVLYAPDDYPGDRKLMWLLLMVETHAAALGKFGVTEGTLHAKYDGVGRTDLWFDPELLRRVAALGISFRITCAGPPARRTWPPASS